MAKEKLSRTEFQLTLNDQDVTVTGEDFKRRMNPEEFFHYVKGVGEYNTMQRSSEYSNLVVLIPDNNH